VSTEDRSIGAVISDIVGDLQEIVRAEVRLARAEVREEIAKIRRGAVLTVSGAVILVLAFGLMLLSAVYALALVWPLWMAALAVGAVTAVAGAALAMAGRKHFVSVKLPPQRTAATVRENLQWAKTRTK